MWGEAESIESSDLAGELTPEVGPAISGECLRHVPLLCSGTNTRSPLLFTTDDPLQPPAKAAPCGERVLQAFGLR